MKTVLFLLAIVGLSSSAFAANCVTPFGGRATVNASGNKLYIQFARGIYENAVLTANGASSSSYYFRGGMDGLAIVNKAVLHGGSGKVYYSYGQGGHNGNGNHREVTLSCR